jgi:endonuclease/exonuclease/phosphatase family metal-dependent hydrolase
MLEAGAMLLFVTQAARTLFAMLFATIYDAMFDGEGLSTLVLAIGCLLAMLAMPLLAPRQRERLPGFLRNVAVLCALARAPMSIDTLAVRLIFSCLVLGLAGAYLAGLMSYRPSVLAPALALGLFTDQLLRALGHTYDLSLRPWWGLVQVGAALCLIYVTERFLARAQESPEEPAGLRAGLSLGAGLFVLLSLFALPNAAARWTGGSYAALALVMMAATTLPLWPRLMAHLQNSYLARTHWARILALFLVLAGLIVAYRARAAIGDIALVQAVVVFWLLLPAALNAGSKNTAWGVSLGLVLFLLLSTSHALSFTYAYTAALFKGMALPAFVVGALVAVLPVLWPQEMRYPALLSIGAGQRRLWLLVGAAAVVLAGLASWPRPLQLKQSPSSLRLGTYNIHYGFDTRWRLSLEEQARTIAASQADVVALQEVDTGRLTSYGIDNALWLGRRLGMDVVYLPTVEHTTGIALLSRVRILDRDGILLPSAEEPTGIVRATITFQGSLLRVHGIWLGLGPEERERQLTAALNYIGPGPATLAGDMNATPDSPTYARMLAEGFADPFVVGGFDPAPTSPAINPRERIDYVWVRGLDPVDARVLPSLASDHRMVVVEVD